MADTTARSDARLSTTGDLPRRMEAAVYKRPGVVEIEERPVVSPGPDQVLVEVSHCGVCGSDIHMILEGWGTPGSVLGHEFTGTVRAVGPSASARWTPGDQVVGGPGPRCGRCRRCLEGKPSQCENRGGPVDDDHDGAFARYVLCESSSLLALPPGLDERSAALAEPLAVALHGITRSGIAPGDRAMVFGAGPIGALTVAALVASGIGPVTVVEPGAERRTLAEALGADRVVDPSELEIFPMWEPERISPTAVDVVFECSGKKAAIEAGFNQLRRGGHLVLVGAGIDAPTFDPNRLLLNELHISGSYVYDADGFDRALELLASGRIPVGLLIEADDVPLDRLGDSLVALARGAIAGKVMIVPGAAGGSGAVPVPAPDNGEGT